MNELPEIGKISPEIFDEMIFPRLGAKTGNILVGPQHGVDAGIIEIGDKAVSVTTDPVFIVPEYGWEKAAWFALHIIASDAVTSGLNPKYLSIDLNLPMEMTKEQLDIVWGVIHSECEQLGISIICGHTARYDNCHFPMVGGATMLSIGEKDDYVTPSMAKDGDSIIITKGPAIEASGILAAMFTHRLEQEFGFDLAQRAQKIFYKMSAVKDALTAVSVGVRDNGVSAMHDATECGIWGGVYELAQAANLGARINKKSIVIEDCVPEICSCFGIDPYASISEGTLIISCRDHKAQTIVDALSQKGIRSSVVGELIDPKHGIILVHEGGEVELEHPIVDPFWKAFYEALSELESSARGSNSA